MQLFSQPYRRTTGRLSVSLTRDEESSLLVVEKLRDAPQTLHRLSAVLFVHGWDITHADISTQENREVIDRFVIRQRATTGQDPAGRRLRDEVDDLKFEAMMGDFERLLFTDLAVPQYLAERGLQIPAGQGSAAQIDFRSEHNRRTVTIVCDADHPGLLMALTGVFAAERIEILEARIHTSASGQVRNTFVLDPADARWQGETFRETVTAALRSVL